MSADDRRDTYGWPRAVATASRHIAEAAVVIAFFWFLYKCAVA